MLFPDEEISTFLTGVSRLRLVLLDMFLKQVRILQDLPALETNHLSADCVLGVVGPQTRLLHKLSRAELAVIIFLSS